VHAENLNPDVTVMKSTKGGMRFDASGRLSGLRLQQIKTVIPDSSRLQKLTSAAWLG
jgi:ribosome-interacting GTPase 1